VHRSAQCVGHLPELRFIADVGGIALLCSFLLLLCHFYKCGIFAAPASGGSTSGRALPFRLGLSPPDRRFSRHIRTDIRSKTWPLPATSAKCVHFGLFHRMRNLCEGPPELSGFDG